MQRPLSLLNELFCTTTQDNCTCLGLHTASEQIVPATSQNVELKIWSNLTFFAPQGQQNKTIHMKYGVETLYNTGVLLAQISESGWEQEPSKFQTWSNLQFSLCTGDTVPLKT